MKNIKVLGFTVTPEVEAACLKRMRKSWFRAKQITDVAWDHPNVTFELAIRISDRLIQRERKAGNIMRFGGGWIRS